MTTGMKVVLVLLVLGTINFAIAPFYMWGLRPSLQDLQNIPQWAQLGWLSMAYANFGLVYLFYRLERRAKPHLYTYVRF